MTIRDLLKKCEIAFGKNDYKGLIGLCDEIFKMDSKNQIAIGYKSVAYCFLNQPEKALEILEDAIKLYPNNHYLKNNLAMAYYDLGDYQNSLKCCEQGLKIKDFEWLCENKIKALIKLKRVDEAIECYENSSWVIDIYGLLIEAGEYSAALKYCLEGDPDEYCPIIDRIKEANPKEVGDYYLSWIYKIRSKSNIRSCPECGGDLVPIVWGFPSPQLLEKAERGEVSLGGCVLPINNPNYHCKKCEWDFDLGHEGFDIECDDIKLTGYIEYKIDEFNRQIRDESMIFIRSFEGLKGDLKGFDDEEFNAFINHLTELGHVSQPREGYLMIEGFDDLKSMKEYLDEGKFAAPHWLAFPQFSAWTIGWRMGAGEDYVMNHPHHSREYGELFPMPLYWKFNFSKSSYKPHPPIGFFWNEEGKPKYPNVSGGVEVNDFITLSDEKEFHSDTFRFKSIEHALLLSKYLYFDKCRKRDNIDELKGLEFTPEEEKTWDIYRYSVLLNASYFKIMQDESLKQRLLETGDEPLVYVSDDGENLFGRALMELRDEIRRICKNDNLIDWEYTEYLKCKPW